MIPRSEKIIEAGAREDAAFDGRPWESMSRADRERYLARARRTQRVVLPMAIDALLKEAEGQSAGFNFQAALAEYRDAEYGFHSGRVAVVKSLRTRLSEIMDGLK